MNRIIYLLLGLALLALPASANVSFSTPSSVDLTFGDPLTLTGTADHTTVLYLFMTGPGLNSNGVSLMDRQALVETGNMIRVPVAPDGHWEYTWYTQGISGKSGLSGGTYTLYASDTPNHAQALSRCTACAYDTIQVALTIPVSEPPAPVATGTIDIRSTSPGVSVHLDGAPRGSVPVVLTGIPVGNHVLEFRSSSCYSLSIGVDVVEGTQTIHASPLAFPKTGSISITSSPSGYPIIINGANTGIFTPGTVTGLTTGLQIVELRPPGYNNWKRSVTVYPGKTEILVADLVHPGTPVPITPDTTPLPAETGSLRATSIPAGANVNVGDRYYGITPLTIENLESGPYQVTISLTGYEPWSSTVSIPRGETVDLSPTLNALPQPAPVPFPIFAVFAALLTALLVFWRR